jgi:hypothetical protein
MASALDYSGRSIACWHSRDDAIDPFLSSDHAHARGIFLKSFIAANPGRDGEEAE